MLGVEVHGLIPFFNSTQSALYLFHRQPSPLLGVFDLDGVLSTTLESCIRKKISLQYERIYTWSRKSQQI